MSLILLVSVKYGFSLPLLLVWALALSFYKVPKDKCDCNRHYANKDELN